MIRVVIYSDQPILAKGLETLIASDPALAMSAYCSRVSSLKEQMANQRAHLAVVDLTPAITLATLAELQRVAPDCKLILWTNTVAGNFAIEALSSGVSGILRKTLSLEAHRQCLHKVYGGGLWFEKSLTDSLHVKKRILLTRRESQLVSLLARGLTNREISAELGVTEGTVKVYLSHLFQKSGAKDRLELALHGLKNLTMAGISAEGQSGLRSLVMETACVQ